MSVVFSILGLLLGFLVYDGMASPSALHRSDCSELEPYVDSFITQTEVFMAKDPAKWHRVRELYNQHAEKLRAFDARTDVMKKRATELAAAVTGVEDAIYRFNPNEQNRQRIQVARQELDARYDELKELCP
jgi:hypothetical protein